MGTPNKVKVKDHSNEREGPWRGSDEESQMGAKSPAMGSLNRDISTDPMAEKYQEMSYRAAKLEAERDQLRGREKELVKALEHARQREDVGTLGWCEYDAVLAKYK